MPGRKVSRHFGIARSTLYRWLHKIEDQKPSAMPMNKTPTDIATLVWEITQANLSWGRIRVANQIQLLGIFLSASTEPPTHGFFSPLLGSSINPAGRFRLGSSPTPSNGPPDRRSRGLRKRKLTHPIRPVALRRGLYEPAKLLSHDPAILPASTRSFP